MSCEVSFKYIVGLDVYLKQHYGFGLILSKHAPLTALKDRWWAGLCNFRSLAVREPLLNTRWSQTRRPVYYWVALDVGRPVVCGFAGLRPTVFEL